MSLQKEIVLKLSSWFALHKRDLPWRQAYDPYQVWISEIMLQQTQMERVVSFFQRWMERFPDIESVALAHEEEILKAWEGLGYYTRAKNIRNCARTILSDYGGSLPADHEALLKLPGIGPYTAGAIMSIAFNEQYPLVDGNVKRVFARLYNLNLPAGDPELKEICWQKARELVELSSPREFNQALMELGALICTPKAPACKECPLTTICLSVQENIVHLRPLPAKGPQQSALTGLAVVICHQGKIYIQKRLPGTRWGNLWEFPGGHPEGERPGELAIEREVFAQTGFKIHRVKALCTLQHKVTRYLVTLHGFSCLLSDTETIPTLAAAQDFRWLPLEELDAYTFSAGHRQLLNALLSGKLPFTCE